MRSPQKNFRTGLMRSAYKCKLVVDLTLFISKLPVGVVASACWHTLPEICKLVLQTLHVYGLVAQVRIFKTLFPRPPAM